MPKNYDDSFHVNIVLCQICKRSVQKFYGQTLISANSSYRFFVIILLCRVYNFFIFCLGFTSHLDSWPPKLFRFTALYHSPPPSPLHFLLIVPWPHHSIFFSIFPSISFISYLILILYLDRT